VRSTSWSRPKVTNEVRDDVWRYVTQAARREPDILLEAASLLRMSANEVRTLACLQFILSEEVGRLLREMPMLVRRLATTTAQEEEWSAERVRGPIAWAPTFGARAASGLTHVYVTAPARRAFQTPENELLVFALDAIAEMGRRTGWHRSASVEIGGQVRERVADATRWLWTRMLGEVERRPVTPRTVARVRESRTRRRYEAALEVFELHQRFVARLDRAAIRTAVERHALVSSHDDVLLELVCLFGVEKALKKTGWTTSFPGLVRGGRILEGERGGSRLQLFYQHAPPDLVPGSVYRDIQKKHSFSGVGGLIPDMVMRISSVAKTRWLLIEVKGVQRPVADSARAAVFDLLAYRRAFEPVLASDRRPYGLGIAWGAELTPSTDSEICLCTPDTIDAALGELLGQVDVGAV
jgi:hypothetical protein